MMLNDRHVLQRINTILIVIFLLNLMNIFVVKPLFSTGLREGKKIILRYEIGPNPNFYL